MSKEKYIKVYDKSMRKFLDLCNLIVVLYTILMLAVFPFFIRSFSTSREDKYYFFVFATLTVFLALCSLYAINFQPKPKGAAPLIQFCNRPKFNAVDILLLTFLAVNIISSLFATLNGGNFSDFINGTKGRNMGLLMITTLTLAYFIISRFYVFKRGFFAVVIIGMAIMSILAILNYYYFDPLGLFKNYQKQPYVIRNFTTTIGNKNYLSALLCVALPLAIGVAVTSNDLFTKIVAYIGVGVQFMGLIVATSDGGFLGCFVGIVVILLFSARNLKRLSRFFICATIMVASGKLLWLFDVIMKGNNKGYMSFSKIFIYQHYLFVLIPLFLILAFVFSKINDESGNISKILFRIICGCLIAFVLAVFVLIVYFTNNSDVSTGEFTSFFRFDEEWGTHRGFFWIRSFEMFKDFSFVEKLFGVGPANFVEPFLIYDEELIARYNETHADAAHNVYINYLITNGLFGATVYIGFIAAAIRDVIRNIGSNPMTFALSGAMIAYIAQDFVNLANPVNTPWLFVLIAMTQSCYLKHNTSEYIYEDF